MKRPSAPFPKDERFIYWFVSAILAAIVGGLFFSWASRNDLFKLKAL